MPSCAGAERYRGATHDHGCRLKRQPDVLIIWRPWGPTAFRLLIHPRSSPGSPFRSKGHYLRSKQRRMARTRCKVAPTEHLRSQTGVDPEDRCGLDLCHPLGHDKQASERAQ